LTGVGTGDIKTAFKEAYIARESTLSDRYRLRAHNQYLTMWATYGLLGLMLFLVITFWPILTLSGKDLNVQMIVILLALSFLTEDTLESQAGVMFMAFFYSLFTSKKSLSLFELRRPKGKDVRPSSDVL
jgi:O-antigen ligase